MKITASIALILAACTPTEPPGASTASPRASATINPTVAPRGSAEPVDAALVDAGSARNGARSVDLVDAGSLEAADGTLAQTDERPAEGDPLTLARARALFEAFVADDPALGQAFFFPLDAYKQVKDSSAPEADWKNRLIAAYGRDLHEIRRARPHLKDAKLVGLEIPEAGVKWIKPGEEYNKIGYFRVFKSNLLYETATGEKKSIELKSLISWRGHFFLVHLSSFK